MNKFKVATLSDLDSVVSIIDSAISSLKEDKSTQWQSGIPNRDTLRKDILNKTCYVLFKDGLICATVNLTTEKDPNYEKIDGKWLNEDEVYMTIHRFAVLKENTKAGLGRQLFTHSIEEAKKQGVHQLRIDTHKENKKMIGLITSFDFIYRGIVKVKDPKDPYRNAYQKFI
ncbi:MAG: GNAT family N-acetyltransferase [Erysipelothrix sp.]|nr:GNAT family N-acetyltransferase [Erysipelothrix sp.]